MTPGEYQASQLYIRSCDVQTQLEVFLQREDTSMLKKCYIFND